MWLNFGNHNIHEMFERMKNKESSRGYSNAGQRKGKISEEKRPPAEANTKKDVKYNRDGEALIFNGKYEEDY